MLELEPVYSCWADGRRWRGSQEHTRNSQIAWAGEPGACVGVLAAELRGQGAAFAFAGLLKGGLLCSFSSPPTYISPSAKPAAYWFSQPGVDSNSLSRRVTNYVTTGKSVISLSLGFLDSVTGEQRLLPGLLEGECRGHSSTASASARRGAPPKPRMRMDTDIEDRRSFSRQDCP